MGTTGLLWIRTGYKKVRRYLGSLNIICRGLKTNKISMQIKIGWNTSLRLKTWSIRLQPYRQSSIKINGVEKLKPHFYGPYRVSRRVGEVAYEIEFPLGNKIHNVFHVSCLKKALGQ